MLGDLCISRLFCNGSDPTKSLAFVEACTGKGVQAFGGEEERKEKGAIKCCSLM